jgi:hypothetical protein
MIEFTLRRTTTAPIDTVFDAMTNHRGIADYLWACRRSTLDREGTPRRTVLARSDACRQSGAPVRDHVGTVELREAGAGTEVSWHLRSTLKIPGVDRLMLPVFKRVIGELLNGGINAAEGAA